MFDKSARHVRIFTVLAWMSLLLYAVIFSLSPMNGEDFALTHDYHDQGLWARLLGIVAQSHVQIVTWNARLGEQLTILWLGLPKPIFTFAAVTSFLALNFFVAHLGCARAQAKEKIVLALCLIFALWPGMEVFFWRTAQAGYLQPILLCLVCVGVYTQPETLKRLCASPGYLTGLSLVAVLAGVSFENVPVALGAYMLACWLALPDRATQKRALIPVACLLAGWLVLVMAPSTAIRREHYRQALHIPPFSLEYALHRGRNVAQVFFSSSGLLFGLYLLSAAYLLLQKPRNIRLLLATVPGFLVVVSLVAAPYTEPRAFLLAWALMFAVVVEAVYQLIQRSPCLAHVAVGVFVLSFCFELHALTLYTDFSQQVAVRDHLIASKIGTQACTDGVPVQQIKTLYPYRYLNNRDDWFAYNLAKVSEYYGCTLRIN